VLLGWAITRAHGLGYLINEQPQVPQLRAVHAGVRALAHRDDRLLGDAIAQHAGLHPLGRSQREQAVGQIVALPTTMTVFAAMGVMITSARRSSTPTCRPAICGIR